MRVNGMFRFGGGVAVAVMLGAFLASAAVVDLTTAGSSGTVNGAIFQQIDPQATGTGVINSFVQIGGNTDVVHAYNTTVNNTLNNGASDQFNHELLLSLVPIVNISGTDYRQFLLDINQTGADPLLSLDDIQVFVSNTPNQSVTSFNASGQLLLSDATLVYRLDTLVADNYILLDYSLNSGSGSGDMFMYIPDSVFTGGQYVYLYSLFGENYNNNDGFEEWAVLEATVVPEPASLSLLGLGVAGMAARSLRRRMKKA